MIDRMTHTEAHGEMVFGMHLVMDLDGCDLQKVSDVDDISDYAGEIVDEIGMVAYGRPILKHFGHSDPVTAGWTLVQLIETSSITGHFSPHLHRAHLDIFSCRTFDAEKAVEFSAQFFGATSATVTVLVR